MNQDPSVSVVVVNFNGRHHLEDCLDSLESLDYPKDRLELLMVDNASTDDSVAFVRERFPGVKIVGADHNLGFAGGCNLGARGASGEFLALVNNDARVDERWLKELLAPIDPPAGVVCSSGLILTWDGERIDFARGAATFYGYGNQVGDGAPASAPAITDGPVLFACGGSMLVDRSVYLELGGFDEDYFALFEDVDFGWRLWVCGYQTAAAPEAVCYHRVHATSGSVPPARLHRYFARNALWTIIKNASEPNMAKMLSAAVLLTVRRAALMSGLDRSAYEMWSSGDAEGVELTPDAAALIAAVDEVTESFPEVYRKRLEVQRRRKRSDAEVFRHFARPHQPIIRLDAYLTAQAGLARLLGIDEIFPESEAAAVLILPGASDDHAETWGPRARSWAKALEGIYEVTFEERSDPERLRVLAETHGIVLAHASNPDLDSLPPAPLRVVEVSGVEPDAGLAGASDVLVAPDPQSAEGWSALEGAAVVIAGSDARVLAELLRNPDALWQARGLRRLGRFTYEVEVLMDEVDVLIRSAEEGAEALRQRVAGLEDENRNLRREYEAAMAELERLRNHYVMRGYSKIRSLLPSRPPTER